MAAVASLDDLREVGRLMAQYLIGVAVPLTLMGLIAIGRWVRKILAQLEKVHVLAVGVDKAVNGRPIGDPTLYEMVEKLRDDFHQHMADDEFNFADMRQRLPPK